MHSTSSGTNKEISVPFTLAALRERITIPHFKRDELIKLATRWAKDSGSLEFICVNYLRHCSQYDTWMKAGSRTISGDATHLFISKRVFDAIAEAYPWLSDECAAQFKKRCSVRVVKRSMLTSLHVEELNAREEAAFKGVPEDEEDTPEDVTLNGSPTSLASERFLYFPPFLKPNVINARRFGEQPSDRWWEWEEELGLESTLGRPHEVEA